MVASGVRASRILAEEGIETTEIVTTRNGLAEERVGAARDVETGSVSSEERVLGAVRPLARIVSEEGIVIAIRVRLAR